jgi:hypothetical protein
MPLNMPPTRLMKNGIVLLSRDSPHNSSNNSSSLEDTILHESATSEVGHESIEVMTNVTIDYQ